MANELIQIIKKKSWPAVIVLAGELFFRVEGIRLLRQEAQQRQMLINEYDWSTVAGDGNSAGIFDDLRGGDLFNEEKLICVHPATKFLSKHKALITRYMEKPIATSVLVISVDRASTAKAFKQNAHSITYKKLYPNQISAWLIQHAREQNIKLPMSSAGLLCELLGDNMFKLDAALSKCMLAVGDAGTISRDCIVQLIAADKDANIFDLQDSIIKGELSSCLHILARYSDQEMHMAASTFSRTIRNLRNIRILAKTGIAENAIAQQLSLHPFVVKKHMPGARANKMNALNRKLYACQQADLSLKSTSNNPRHTVESLAVKICS